MKKHWILILTILLSVIVSSGIGYYNYTRMYPVEPQVEIYYGETINNKSSQYYTKSDSVYIFNQRGDTIITESAPPPEILNSIPAEFTPSEAALEFKFWVDILISLLSSLSPFVVPVIVWKYKTKNNNKE